MTGPVAREVWCSCGSAQRWGQTPRLFTARVEKCLWVLSCVEGQLPASCPGWKQPQVQTDCICLRWPQLQQCGIDQDAAAGASHPAESSRCPSSGCSQATTLSRAQHSTAQQAADPWAGRRRQPGPGPAGFMVLGGVGALLWLPLKSPGVVTSLQAGGANCAPALHRRSSEGRFVVCWSWAAFRRGSDTQWLKHDEGGCKARLSVVPHVPCKAHSG